MKNNVWLWVGVAALVIGSVFACFTDIVNNIPALVIAAFGLGAMIISTWNKSEQKDWKVIVSICCCSVGGFCCAVASLTQDTTVKIVTAVTALVSLIIGIIFGSLKKKD